MEKRMGLIVRQHMVSTLGVSKLVAMVNQFMVIFIKVLIG